MKQVLVLMGAALTGGFVYFMDPSAADRRSLPLAQVAEMRTDGQDIFLVRLEGDAASLDLAGRPRRRRTAAVEEVARMQPLAFHRRGDQLFVVDTPHHVVRRLDPVSGNLTIFAGQADAPGDRDGPGRAAAFAYPAGLARAGDELILSDTHNHRLRAISIASGQVRTLAGAGQIGFQDGRGRAARFHYPGPLVARGDDLYVADTGNHAVRKIDPASGQVSTLAGTGSAGMVDGRGAQAAFRFPIGLARTGDGLLVADAGNFALRAIRLPAGEVRSLGTREPGRGFFQCLRDYFDWCRPAAHRPADD